MKRFSLGLRSRITVAFALGGLISAIALAIITITITRQVLLADRAELAEVLIFANASRVQGSLTGDNEPGAIQGLLESLNSTAGSRQLLSIEGAGFSRDGQFVLEQVPITLRTSTLEGDAVRIRTALDDEPVIVYGIPLQGFDNAVYFEALPLNEVEDTLATLRLVLLGGGLIVSALAALAGRAVATSALSPLTDVSNAAVAIASGRLDTRLDPEGDEDLESLVASFNEMAGGLEERIQRDARFASEVSHELRSPLMTLTASVEVLENARHEMPERSQTALDLLASDITRFRTLVEDLLEISKFDVGTAALQADPLLYAEFVRAAMQLVSGDDIEIIVDPDAEDVIVVAEKRRLARVVANLVDNAAKYGGGAKLVHVSRSGDNVLMAVEDDGPGVPLDERFVIFDRFSRGGAGGRRGYDTGVGLGLSLVAEHVNLHGGRVWVEDRLDGQPGARFVVELPIDDEPPGEFA